MQVLAVSASLKFQPRPATLMGLAFVALLAACDATYSVDGTSNPDGRDQPSAPAPTNDADIVVVTDVDAGTNDVLPSIQVPPERGVGSFLQVSKGAAHACGIKSDGQVDCWGSNFSGESLVNLTGTFKQVVTGTLLGCQNETCTGFSCALSSTNDVSCWGGGLITPPAQEKFVELAAGAFACGRREDGRVLCWGPAPPAPPDSFIQIDVGSGGSACGVKANGAVLCWGEDFGAAPQGQFKQVSVGAGFACGLAADTSITCWSRESSGVYTPPSGQGFSAVSAGSDHACAVRGGVVTCWGSNDDLQTEVPDLRFTSVSAGFRHTCATEPNGGLLCWGRVRVTSHKFTTLSASGKSICALGLDGLPSCWGAWRDDRDNPPRERFKDIATSYATTCGIQINGEINCWDGRSPGEMKDLPRGTFRSLQVTHLGGAEILIGAIRSDGTLAAWMSHSYLPPPKIPPSGQFIAVAVSWGTLCALAQDGLVGCWDENGPTASPPGKFVKLSMTSWGSDYGTCAVAADERVACWHPSRPSELPTQLPGRFVEVAQGSSHGCGRAVDGRIMCWGSDSHGRATPPSGSFVQISAGFDHTCALDAEQRPWCWGDYVMHPM